MDKIERAKKAASVRWNGHIKKKTVVIRVPVWFYDFINNHGWDMVESCIQKYFDDW